MSVKFGDKMMQARKEKGLSREELGEKIGTSGPIIGRYERGDASPSADVLNRIANALEVNPDFLMNGTMENKAIDSLKDERLLIQFKKIEQLPENKKALLIEFLEGFIFKSTIHQQLAV